MKRRWKVLIAALAALAALVAVNAIVVAERTRPAERTVAEGRLVSLPGGELQVLETPAERARPGAPIVLLHCYACSLRWWDELVPLLRRDHRVIRVDLLGFGGSEKPSSGYAVEDQAQLVAGALSELDVQGAVVVGQSMGAAMAISLAERASQLVDRVVDLSLAPTNESSSLPLLARLSYTPVLGPAMWRITPDFAIREGFEDAFAPGYEPPPGFEDVIVEDFRAMTYTSYHEAEAALEEFRDAEPLDERIASALVPLLAIFGAEDQIVDTGEAAEGFRGVLGARVVTLPGIGHTPQIEAPARVAKLILAFAADAGEAAETPRRQP